MALPTPIKPGPWPHLRFGGAQALAGTLGSLAILAVPLSLGLLAFAALGPAAARAGVTAAFVTITFGGLLYALASRAAMPTGGPSSATSLILGGLAAQLVADAAVFDGSATGAQRVLAGCGIAVALSGLLQVAFARVGMARLARMVPRPVLGGFMNGVALLILVGQVPLVLGLPSASWPGPDGWSAMQPWALALAALTVVGIVVLTRLRTRLPPLMTALVAATALHAGLTAAWPALALGPTVGDIGFDGIDWPMQTVWGSPQALVPLIDHAGAMLATAVVLALIGTLESMLGLLALDEQLATRHDPGRELAAIGACNLIGGLLGGLPMVLLRARAIAIVQAGGRTALAAAAGSLAAGLLFVPGAALLAMLPLPVLGAIMVVIGVGLVDRWAGRMFAAWWRTDVSADLRAGLTVMLSVCLLTLWQGFAAGVVLGLLLSMLIFIARMNRSLLRTTSHGGERRSRRIWPAALERQLEPLRPSIAIWELEGAVFFGNADRLLEQAEVMPAGSRALVLCLARVTSVDETGAAALARLSTWLQRRGVTLLLAAGDDEQAPVGRALRAYGITLPRLPDADRAIEQAELHVLGANAEQTQVAVPLESSDLFRGLAAPERSIVAARMPRRVLAPDERLFAQGDAADGLFVVVQGSVTVIGRAGHRSRRYLSISPGMMLGETAMLDGGRRSADAVADAACVLHHLGSATLHELGEQHPHIASTIHRNIAVHLSARLRAASAAWFTAGADGTS